MSTQFGHFLTGSGAYEVPCITLMYLKYRKYDIYLTLLYIYIYISYCHTEQARGPAKISPYSLATDCVKPFWHYIAKALLKAVRENWW